MGKPPSKVARVAGIAWKRTADISTAAWLWSIVPSGLLSVIAGWLAYGEGLPKAIVLLIALATLAFVMFSLAGWRIWRSVAVAVESDRLFQEELAKLEAVERAKHAVAVKRISGGIGAGITHQFDEQESDRKAAIEIRAVLKAKAQLMRDRLATRRHTYGVGEYADTPEITSYLAAMWEAEERGAFYDEYHRSTFMPLHRNSPTIPGNTIAEVQRNVAEYEEGRRQANLERRRRQDSEKGY